MKLFQIVAGLLVVLVGAVMLHYEAPHNPISQIYISIFPSDKAGRYLRLPSGEVLNIRIRADMTTEQIREALIKKGVEGLETYNLDTAFIYELSEYRNYNYKLSHYSDEKLINWIYKDQYTDITYRDFLQRFGYTPTSSIWNRDWMIGVYIMLVVFISVETLITLIGYSVRGNIVVRRLTIVLSALWIIVTLAVSEPFTDWKGDFRLNLEELLLLPVVPVVIVWGIIWILKGSKLTHSDN